MIEFSSYSFLADGVVLMDLLGLAPSKLKVLIENSHILAEVLALQNALAISGMIAQYSFYSVESPF
jgi:hypothetical protein